MPAPQDLSRTSSVASSFESISSQNAALRGATTAFGRPTTNGRALSGNKNEALAAATRADLHRTRTSPTPGITHSSTDDSIASAKSADTMSTPNLSPPLQKQLSKSPSHQAASLAAARAPPPLDLNAGNNGSNVRARTASTKTPAVPPKPRRLSSYGRSMEKTETDRPTDSTPIGPTNSLVNMFERKSISPQSAGAKPDPIVIKPSNDLPLRSPKPVRTPSGITTLIQKETENSQSTPTPAARSFTAGSSKVPEEDLRSAATAASVPTSKTATTPKSPLPPPPPRRDALPDPEKSPKEPSKPSVPPRGRPVPLPSPLPATTQPIPIEPPSKTTTSPTETISPSSASMKSIPAQYKMLHPRSMTPHMTGDQLADAMVAGSLASSRQPSPTRHADPPPLPNRRHKHHTFSISRTPSPAKAGMKKTLRQTQSDDSDDGEDGERLYPYSKHKVQKRLGKHPNKHHEGDRKRWREAVTEHERKRYEGVWAANKGLYCSFTLEEQRFLTNAPDASQARELKDAVAEQVSNLVVREIWSRSRLQDAVLENVWDLVDNEGVGRLTKEEFVVGLWLIDGRLRGKKLPVKVSDSVWRSVKGLQKLKMKKSGF